MKAKLNEELTDFLARRGEYADDVDVWPTPQNPAKPLTGADVRAGLTASAIIRQTVDGLEPGKPADSLKAVLDAEIRAQRDEWGAIESASVFPEPAAAPSGVKHDGGKPMLSLLGMVTRALADVTRVQEYGAKKYPSPDNWKHVPNGSRRYRDAALRHLFADLRGEAVDPETGLPHLAHAACCLLIAREHDLGFTQADDGVELTPLAPAPEGEPLPSWRFERPPKR